MSKFDYYCFQGSTMAFAELGEPYKISAARYHAMNTTNFRLCKVPEGTSKEAVIIKHLIDTGSHIKSYNVARALEKMCNVKITFEEIEK